MSEDLDNQTATETTDAGATPPVEATGAPEKKDDLDALLDQYRKETGSTEQPQTTTQPAAPAAADTVSRAEFEAARADWARERQAREFSELAKGVRAAGDLPDVLSDQIILGLVDGLARSDPALVRAWTDSANDPKARSKLIQKVGESLGQTFAKARGVDENATADREAVAASVRGNGNKAPEGKAPDYGKLSDQEFRKECDKYGISF